LYWWLKVLAETFLVLLLVRTQVILGLAICADFSLWVMFWVESLGGPFFVADKVVLGESGWTER
jgi:hypothetical protein